MLKSDHSQSQAPRHNLGKQRSKTREMAQPERVHRAEVRHLTCCKVHEIGAVDHTIPDRPAAHYANVISVEQYLQHHLRVIGRVPFLEKAVLRYVYEKSLPLIVRPKVVLPIIDRRRFIQTKALHIRLTGSLSWSLYCGSSKGRRFSCRPSCVAFGEVGRP